MIRVRVAPALWAVGCDPRNFFDLNCLPYEIVEDHSPVDVLVVAPWQSVTQSIELKKQYAHRISVELDIWHGFENGMLHMQEYCRQNGLPYAGNHYLITHIINDRAIKCSNIIYTDHCFNKAKAAYTHFPYHHKWIPTGWDGPYTYIMPKLNNRSHNRVFLAPNRVDTARADHQVRARFDIHRLIESGYNDLGYVSNGTNYLHNHSNYPAIDNIDWLRSQPAPPTFIFGQGIHNLYYQDTFISVYGETMEHGTTEVVTEKTYDPLAKGHFILPFSTPGFLSMVQARGFKLPEFIDYSYDIIDNYDRRLTVYLAEAQRLLSIPTNQWRELYYKNLDLLYHNQLVFHRRPYQQVDIVEILSKQK